MSRRISAVVILVMALATGGLSLAGTSEVTVYKSPSCGCCKNWMKHMQDNGFTVKSIDVVDVSPYRMRHGVPPTLASCHTALVEGYTIEGHVPAADIRRLLKERPRVRGLAAPGMPSGSPGMEQGSVEPYDVLSFDKDGKVLVYSRH